MSIGSFFEKTFSKQAIFKVNLALRADKLIFWQTFSVRLVIAEVYVSRRRFEKKPFGNKRVSSSKLADQNLFRIRQTFLSGSRNWSQIVQKISCGKGNFIFQNTLIIISQLWGTLFQFYAVSFPQSCHICFLQVQSIDLKKTICFKLYNFTKISRLSAKSFRDFGETNSTVDKTIFFLS